MKFPRIFAVVFALSGTLTPEILCFGEEREIYSDPGWDNTWLPGRFCPLKSRMAEKYHLNQENPSPEERALVANDFFKLRDYERHALLLDILWPRAKCDAFIAILEPLLVIPDKADHTYPDSILDLAVIRLVELKSKKAREMVLADMRKLNPFFSVKVLTCLPDEMLPDLESVFRQHMKRDANGDLKSDLMKLTPVISRYGPPALLPDVKKLYQSSKGGWACDIQKSLLRYLIKHEPNSGLESLERALLFRGGPGQNNCFGSAIHETLSGMNGRQVQEFAIRHLDDSNLMISYSAARYLIEDGSIESRQKVIEFFHRLPMEADRMQKEPKFDRRRSILSAFLPWPEITHHRRASAEELNTLKSLMTDGERADFEEQIRTLRAAFEKGGNVITEPPRK